MKQSLLLFCCTLFINTYHGLILIPDEKPTCVTPTLWTPADKGYFFNIFFKTNWFQAHLFCAYNGMQLFTPATETELSNVITYLRKNVQTPKFFWTSGTDNGSEGEFFWMTTGQPVNFWNGSWTTNQPDNGLGVENCLHLWPEHGYLLNDINCMNECYFICETKRK